MSDNSLSFATPGISNTESALLARTQLPIPAPAAPVAAPIAPPAGVQTIIAADGTQLDAGVVNLSRAIRQQESGGNYNAIGDNGTSHGAFQWQPGNFAAAAKQFGLDPTDFSPVNQDKVAYQQIAHYKNQGYSPEQIASLWNSGKPDPTGNVGDTTVNGKPLHYDTPTYVNNVMNNFQQFKQQGTQNSIQQNPSDPQINDSFAQFFRDIPDMSRLSAGQAAQSAVEGIVKGGIAPIANFIPSALKTAWGIGSTLGYPAMHPIIASQAIGNTIMGAAEYATGTPGEETKYVDAAANILKSLPGAVWDNLVKDYGSPEAIQHTIATNPAQFILDATVAGDAATGIARGTAGLADVVGGTTRGAVAANNAATFADTGLNVMPKFGAARGAVEGVLETGSQLGEAIAQPAIQGAANAVGKTVGKIADITVPAATDVSEAAKRQGVQLPASALTTSPWLHQLEVLTGTGIGGQEGFIRNVERAVSDMNNVVTRIVDSTKGATDLAQGGEIIAQGARDFERAFKDAYAATEKVLDGKLTKTLGTSEPVAQTDTIAQWLQKTIEEQKSVGATTAFWEKQLAILTGAKKFVTPTLGTIRKLKTEIGRTINNRLDPFATGNQFLLRQYEGRLIDAEMKTVGATGVRGVSNLYRGMKEAYAKGMTEIGTTWAKTIRKMAANGQYSKIIESIMKPTMPIEDVSRVLNLVGEEGKRAIQSGVIQKIFEDARNAEGNFTAKGVLRQMEKWQDERGDRLGAMLTPEQVQGMKDVGIMSDAMGQSLSIAAGSRTAFLMRTAGELGVVGSGIFDLMRGNFGVGLSKIGAIVGENAAGYFITSPRGQQMLKYFIGKSEEFQKTGQELGLTMRPNGGNIGGYGNTNGNLPNGSSGPDNRGNNPAAPSGSSGSAAQAPDNTNLANGAVRDSGLGAPGAIEIGATSFRGTPVKTIAETAPYFDTTRAKGFENSLTTTAAEDGIKLNEIRRVAGSWEGSIEPSYQVNVVSTMDKASAYAVKNVAKVNQDAVILFKSGAGGDTKYLFSGLKNPDAALARLHAQGIQGATIDGNSIAVYDIGNELKPKLTAFANEVGVQPTETVGTARLITKDQYGQYGGGNRNSVRPDVQTAEVANPTALQPNEGGPTSVKDAAKAYYDENKAALLKEYLAKHGNYSNTDDARRLYQTPKIGYDGTNPGDVQDVASPIAKAAWKYNLKNGAGDDALVYAGGSGVGKTSSILKYDPELVKNAAAIWDGNSSDFKSLTQKINEAIKAGKTAHLIYVYRPIDKAFDGMVSRMLSNPAERGRLVPISVMDSNHAGSYNAVKQVLNDAAMKKLVKQGKLKITLLDNSADL